MGRCVGVAAGNRRARLGDTLLRSDDVNDTLLTAWKVEKLDPVIVAIFAKGLDHRIREIVAEWLLALIGRNNVIHRCKGTGRIKNLQAQIPQHAECLWAGDLVNEVRAN